MFRAALALGRVSQLRDCPGSLFDSQWLPVVKGVTRPVQGGSESEPRFRLIGSQTLRQQLLKYANVCSLEGPQV